MHLINPLVAGIRGAEIGSVELLERGTSTHAVYYKDFPATQQYSAQPIPLDSFGSATIYVDELVDVLVHDQNGVLVREFVAGDYAAAVEVISQSFTGVDYRDGTRGPFKPTNLASVLDLWKVSSGTTDWKVLVNSVPVNISLALSGLAGLYFNVKGYGAIGNGTTDDGAAIQSAINAAAVAGGTVFFPPGTYRTTVTIVVPVNVCLLGSGAPATKLAMSGVATSLTQFPGTDSGTRTVRSMWFGAIGTPFNNSLVLVPATGARVVFEDCLFGNDPNTNGPHVNLSNNTPDSHVLFNRCSFYEMSGAPVVFGSTQGRGTFRDCDFRSVFTGIYDGPYIFATEGMVIDNCRFDASTVTGGSFAYIQMGNNDIKVVSSRFKKGPAVVAAFRNITGTAFSIWENGNSFGDVAGGPVPGYLDTVNDGNIVLGSDVGPRLRGSRLNRAYGTTDPGGPFLADAKNYGVVVIRRSIAGAQTISATLGQLGDALQVVILNSTGGVLAPVFGAGFTLPTAGLGTIPTGGKGLYQFMFLPPTTGALGSWVMTAVSVDN